MRPEAGGRLPGPLLWGCAAASGVVGVPVVPLRGCGQVGVGSFPRARPSPPPVLEAAVRAGSGGCLAPGTRGETGRRAAGAQVSVTPGRWGQGSPGVRPRPEGCGEGSPTGEQALQTPSPPRRGRAGPNRALEPEVRSSVKAFQRSHEITLCLDSCRSAYGLWSRICLQCGRSGFNSWVGKIPWRRERLLTPLFWHGLSQRVKTEQLSLH